MSILEILQHNIWIKNCWIVVHFFVNSQHSIHKMNSQAIYVSAQMEIVLVQLKANKTLWMQKHLSESSIIYKSFSDLLYQESNANGIDWLLYLWVKIRSLLCKETIAELRCHQILKSRALKEPQMFQLLCSSRLYTMRKYENFKRSAFFLGKKKY